MDENTKQILKSVIELLASIQTDSAAIYSLLAESLPNLTEDHRQQLRDEAGLRLKNSQQTSLNAQNL